MTDYDSREALDILANAFATKYRGNEQARSDRKQAADELCVAVRGVLDAAGFRVADGNGGSLYIESVGGWKVSVTPQTTRVQVQLTPSPSCG